jgi:predicted nucleotide-binding protein (sugar kinase/HSP70/actin superfamily)
MNSGADPGFQVRGVHLKELHRAEGGTKIIGVFRVLYMLQEKAFFKLALNVLFKRTVVVVKPVLRGHLWDKEKVALCDRGPLKRG